MLSALLTASCSEPQRANGEPCLIDDQCENDYCRAGMCTTRPTTDETSKLPPVPDAAPDAVDDAEPDAPEDTGVDVMPDAVPDAESDAATDAEADAPADANDDVADAASDVDEAG